MSKEQRNHKDTLFRMLFKEPKNLLSLYNAVNGTNYRDVSTLKITTLENAIYMNMKNDVSFVVSSSLNLYEHQSTLNPNMPLRCLFYLAKMLQNLTVHDDLYGSREIKIPKPQFVVFYNGLKNQSEQWEMKLSDLYEETSGETIPDMLELKVKVYNVNYGKNKELMKACRTLEEYAFFISRIREHTKDMPVREAIEQAVKECIKEGVLRDFLLKHRAEAVEMCLYEYDEELHLKNEREYAYEQGYLEGAEKERKKIEKERQQAEREYQRAQEEIRHLQAEIARLKQSRA